MILVVLVVGSSLLWLRKIHWPEDVWWWCEDPSVTFFTICDRKMRLPPPPFLLSSSQASKQEANRECTYSSIVGEWSIT
jgi:hypothetical protein